MVILPESQHCRQPISMAVGAASWISALPAWADNFVALDTMLMGCDVSHGWIFDSKRVSICGFEADLDAQATFMNVVFKHLSWYHSVWSKFDTVQTGLACGFPMILDAPSAIWRDWPGCQADMCDFVLLVSTVWFQSTVWFASKFHEKH